MTEFSPALQLQSSSLKTESGSVFWLRRNSNPSSVTGPPSEEAKEPPPIRPIYVTSGPLPFSGSQTDVAWLLSSQRFLGEEKRKLTMLRGGYGLFLCVVEVLSMARVTTERCTTTSKFLCGKTRVLNL